MSKNSSTMEMIDQNIPSSFPSGLRVLLVDDNPTCLEILRKKLQEECKYEVTPCTGAKDALSLLVEKKDGFDIVLTEFLMPDMDGLQLLESIQLMEMTSDLPVVLFSGEQDLDAVSRGVEKGACDFLIKPIQDDTLKMIWQHVLRVKLRKAEGVVNNGASEVNQPEISESAINSSSDDATTHPSQGDEVNANKDTAKKPRVKWTPELQQNFDIAINIVCKRKNPDKQFRKDGSEVDRVVPKEILVEMEKMGVKGLTRQHISSFLQKYRLSQRKQLGESSQKQSTYPDPKQTSSGQYYYQPMESNFPAWTAHPATHHHHCTQSSPVNYTPDNYYSYHSRIGQQVNPLPVAMMTKPIVLPQNRQPAGLPIWNMGPHQPMSIHATTQLRPPSAFGGQNLPMSIPATTHLRPPSALGNQCQQMSIPATTQLTPPSAFGNQCQQMSIPATTQLRPPSAFGDKNRAMPIPATTQLRPPSAFRDQNQAMSIPVTTQLRPPSNFGDQDQPMLIPGSHLVNQLDFSVTTNQHQFVEANWFLSTNQVPTVSNSLQGPAEWSADINTAAHRIGQNFSNNYGTHDALPNITNAELDYPSHYPQSSLSNQVSIHFNTTAASDEHASFSLQGSASKTTEDELADFGLLDLDGLDFSWLDN